MDPTGRINVEYHLIQYTKLTRGLAKILFEISCTQHFQKKLSKRHNPEKGHN